MQYNLWNLLILAATILLAQGCSGSSKDIPMSSGPQGAQAIPVAAGPTQSAVLFSDVAFKNSDAQLNQAQTFDAAMAADKGCALAVDYNAILAANDLPASIDAYCASLAAQNVAVRSCPRAQAAAALMAKNVRRLTKACAEPRPEGRRVDTIRVAEMVISAGNVYRRELGLPSAVRLH